MRIEELEQWLQALPLNEPVQIDGETVYLTIGDNGAELGVHYIEQVSDQQIQEALGLGFQHALEYDAGWGISADGSTLMLTQWPPGVSQWTEVPEPLERILNQVAALRGAATAITLKTADIPSRDEQRVRSKLIGD